MAARRSFFATVMITTLFPMCLGHGSSAFAVTSIPISPRIIGGEIVQPGELPYVVGIVRKRDGAVMCGGVVYDSKHVLSAAHCFDQREPFTNYRVLGGSVDKLRVQRPNRVEMDIVKEFKHDLYNGTEAYDLTILKVNGVFPSRMIVPVDPTKRFRPNDECQLAGWGSTVPLSLNDAPFNETSEDAFPSQMHVASFPMLSRKACQTMYKNLRFGPELFCAGDVDGGRDGCIGDSGSPLICDGTLAGIMSAGEGCAQPLRPGVYVNVSHFRSWINATIRPSRFRDAADKPVQRNSSLKDGMSRKRPGSKPRNTTTSRFRARSDVRYQVRTGTETVWRPLKTRHRETTRRRQPEGGNHRVSIT